MARPVVHFLEMRGSCILRQLRLEEALLRSTDRNWCIVNNGSAYPAIVMGLSGFVQHYY